MAGRKQLVEKPTWASTRRTSRCTRYTQNEPLDNAFAIRSIFSVFLFPNPNTERKEACREETRPRRQAFQQLRRQLSCTDRARPCTGKTDDEPDEDHCSRQMYRERLTLYQKMPQPGAADRTPGQRERPLQKNAGKRLRSPRLLSVGSSTPYRIQNDSA